MSTAPSCPNLRWSIQDPTASNRSKPESLLRITPKLALSAAIYVKWLAPTGITFSASFIYIDAIRNRKARKLLEIGVQIALLKSVLALGHVND